MSADLSGRRVALMTVTAALVLYAAFAAAQKWRAMRTAPAMGVTCGESHDDTRLGPYSEKIKRQGGKVLLWAGGGASDSDQTQWYDVTHAALPVEDFQFGIGKDVIRSIDDPLFVAPEDPRLLALLASSRRSNDRPRVADEIMVIGYADGRDVRAYPLALLDRHELVNDYVGGKPVTIGWCPLAKLSVVHGRAQNGQLDEFGVSGYVYKNTFLIFDRRTESLWCPMETGRWMAISGPRKGETIPFMQEPEVVSLGEWRRLHPDTKVLLGPRHVYERLGAEDLGGSVASPGK